MRIFGINLRLWYFKIAFYRLTIAGVCLKWADLVVLVANIEL